MRQAGYRKQTVTVDIDIKHRVVHVFDIESSTYYFFAGPITIFKDDDLEVGTEKIKAGRHVKECVGYETVDGKFENFIVKLVTATPSV